MVLNGNSRNAQTDVPQQFFFFLNQQITMATVIYYIYNNSLNQSEQATMKDC